MRKLAMSTSVIAGVLILVSGVTYALFTAREKIIGNTVSVGSNPINLSVNTSEGLPVHASGLLPGGWDAWNSMDVVNTGSEEFETYVSYEKTSGNDEVYNHLMVEMQTAGDDEVCGTADTNENLFFKGKVIDFATTVPVSNANYYPDAVEGDGSGTPADNVAVGASVKLCQRIGLSDDVMNDLSGETVGFNIVVDAVQDND